MTQNVESNLIVMDSKGEPVAIWRRHPTKRVNILYRIREMSLGDIEKFGSELYVNNCAESLSLKAGII